MRRTPCSFHAETSGLTGPVYTTPARADANASRRPAHSRQRSTGQAVGAPQRPQRGSVTRRSTRRHEPQSGPDEAPQDTHGEGSSRSTSHATDGTRETVACL